MAYSKMLCKYIIESQQKDLITIFENFSNNVKDPYDNTFFLQNSVLDKVLKNVNDNVKNNLSYSSLIKGLTLEDKEIIKPLELKGKLDHQLECCKALGIPLFDETAFLKTIDVQLEKIATNYNLNASDDYNKLYNYICSLKLSLRASDDSLASLLNQYIFLKEHSLEGEYKDEYITIYDEKIDKFKIINELLDSYKESLNTLEKKTMTIKR